jgi:sec-independent protein translocase protein TatA
MTHVLAIGMPGPFEMVIIAGIGLLIFGKRLPDVGRNLALGIRGFQQGLKSPGPDEDADVERKSLPEQK